MKDHEYQYLSEEHPAEESLSPLIKHKIASVSSSYLIDRSTTN